MKKLAYFTPIFILSILVFSTQSQAREINDTRVSDFKKSKPTTFTAKGQYQCMGGECLFIRSSDSKVFKVVDSKNLHSKNMNQKVELTAKVTFASIFSKTKIKVVDLIPVGDSQTYAFNDANRYLSRPFSNFSADKFQ